MAARTAHPAPHPPTPLRPLPVPAGSGVALPLFSLLFGSFTQAFGAYVPACGPQPPPGMLVGMLSDQEFRAQISQIAKQFIYLALGAGVAGALQQGCWMYTSNRQVGGGPPG